MTTELVFLVPGVAVAQGSMVIMNGRIRHQRSERLDAWRKEVSTECLRAMRNPRRKVQMFKPWTGPVSLRLSFIYKATVKAQKGLPKTTAPDLDKLTRAVLDALTGALYEDDRQVTEIEVRKRYAEVGETQGLIVSAMECP